MLTPIQWSDTGKERKQRGEDGGGKQNTAPDRWGTKEGEISVC